MAESLLQRAVRISGAKAVFASLTDEQRETLRYQWRAWARPEQLAPSARQWRVWLILAGRGFGKSRSGAEWVREEVESGRRRRLALVARTAADVRDVIVEGESGIMAISPPEFRPIYEPSKRRLTWPNGAIATTYSADEPNSLRGPQHDGAWADEIAAWNDPDAWDQLMFGLRLGDDPRCVATTTPRPTKLVRDLIADSDTAITRGSTYDNAANLAPSALAAYRKKYEGTRLGRQELHAEVLLDTPGALWTLELLDACHIANRPVLLRISTGVDPSGGRGERGIVTAGIAWCSCKGAPALHVFVIADDSGVHTPDTWGNVAVGAYKRERGDRIVVEKNYGGDMAKALLHTVDKSVPIEEVTATRGKALRAEPVAALYEQGKVHHVGHFLELEDQMRTWSPLEAGPSPDRLDALVWAITDLALDPDAPIDVEIETYGDREWSPESIGGVL